jgi:hypothetical protein
VSSLSKKGIRTAFLNISGNNGHTFDCDDEDEDGECSPRVVEVVKILPFQQKHVILLL